jgi:hypothetical protein
MYKIKNLAEKTLNRKLLEEFLGFANKKLKIDQPYSVYFVDDKVNASDPLGKTAMYNPSSNSVYVYATNRHPKDILRSIAHELMHHKQNCDGRLDKTYGEDSDDLKTLELEANEAGYLVREFEEGRENINETVEELNEVAPLVVGGLVLLASFLLPGDSSESQIKNRMIRALEKAYKEGRITKEQAKKKAEYIKNWRIDGSWENMESSLIVTDLIGIAFPPADFISALRKYELYKQFEGKEDKIIIPLIGEFFKEDFYFVDMCISIASGLLVGQPVKMAMMALKQGVSTTAKAIRYSKALLIGIPTIVQKLGSRVLNKLSPKYQVILTRFESVLQNTINTGKAIFDFKNVLKVDVVGMNSAVRTLNGIDRFNFILGKGPMATRIATTASKFSPQITGKFLAQYIKKAVDIIIKTRTARFIDDIINVADLQKFDDLIEWATQQTFTVTKGGQKVATKVKTVPAAMSTAKGVRGAAGMTRVKTVGGVAEEVPLLTEKGAQALRNLKPNQKKILAWIFSKIDDVSGLSPAQLEGLKDALDMIVKAAEVAKQGTINVVNIAKEMNKAGIGVWDDLLPKFDVKIIQKLEKFPWNKGFEAFEDVAKGIVEAAMPKGKTLEAIARRLIGESPELLKALEAAAKEAEEALKLAREIAEGVYKVNSDGIVIIAKGAAKGTEAAEKIQKLYKFIEKGEGFIGAIYDKHIIKFVNEFLNPNVSSKFGQEFLQRVVSEIDSFVIPLFGGAKTAKLRVSAKIADAIGSDPIRARSFLAAFARIINTNFLGKGFVTGTYIIDGRLVNSVVKFFFNSQKVIRFVEKTSGVVGPVMSGLMASSMFIWLRVLKPVSMAGGSGISGKDEQEVEKSIKAAQEAADELKKPLNLIAAVRAEELEPPPVDIPSAVTAAQAAVEDTDNPPLKNYVKDITDILTEFNKAYEIAKKAKDEEAKRRAAENAKNKLEKTGNKATAAARGKATKAAKGGPKPSPEQKREATKNNGKLKKTTDAAANQAAGGTGGVGDQGTGTTAGTGTGEGFGAGIGDGSNVQDFIEIYLRKRDLGNEHNELPEVLRKQLDKDVGDKLYDIYRKLPKDKIYDELDNNLKVSPQAWLYGPALGQREDNVFFKAKNINDLDKKEALKFLRKVDVEKLKKYVVKESIEQYRNRVLNERYQKLLKGFTK